MVSPEMSQYHCTQEHLNVKTADTHVAEPISVKIAHLEERATEFGSHMTWRPGPASADPEPEREDYP
jgi:hypothetical protein